ncbi:MAG TPA: hypothetical protein VNE41_02020 [Chitinophagaceae bacterium]|nr:hypothetical protein [Chitinophagaceae bacterium]
MQKKGQKNNEGGKQKLFTGCQVNTIHKENNLKYPDIFFESATKVRQNVEKMSTIIKKNKAYPAWLSRGIHGSSTGFFSYIKPLRKISAAHLFFVPLDS